MYILCKDNLLLGGTFFVERATELTVVSTNDVNNAVKFNTVEAAERYAAKNNIRLVNFESDSEDETTSNYHYIMPACYFKN